MPRCQIELHSAEIASPAEVSNKSHVRARARTRCAVSGALVSELNPSCAPESSVRFRYHEDAESLAPPSMPPTPDHPKSPQSHDRCQLTPSVSVA